MISNKILCLIKLVLVLGLANGWIYLLYLQSGAASSKELIGFPTTIEEIQRYSSILKTYSNDSFAFVLLFFASVYIYKQAFAIPGSFFMNLLSGALYGVWKGFILCCVLSAIGATTCYMISKYVTYDLVQSLFPRKLATFSELVTRNKDKLVYFMISIRILPMSPNWAINIASPLVKVPIHYFFISVLFGLMPYNFLTVQAGSALSEITSLNDVITLKSGIGLCCLAAATLGPTLLKRRKQHEHEH